MQNIFHNPDGANYQAQAVLACLRRWDGIEESYSKDRGKYLAEPMASRWHNCREQGYIITLTNHRHSNQINIVFYEHRNHDGICILQWESQCTINPPTLRDLPADTYKDKYDYAKDFDFMQIKEASDYIYQELTKFWIANNE